MSAFVLSQPQTHPLRIAVIAFDGISPLHLAIPTTVFGEALKDPNPFEVVVCSAERQPLRTSAGYRISGLEPLSALSEADVVIVPSWRDVHERPTERLLAALRQAHLRGSYMVGLCLGAHVLAEAGLLKGRRATTHWEYAPEMARRFPDIVLQADVLYVEDEGFMTSAGTAAALDACLQLVRRRLGSTRATQAARRLVIAPHRDGGQAQFIEQPLPLTASSHRLSHLLESLRQRLNETHDLQSLAEQARMSRRSFTRHFKALTGSSVLHWLLSERLRLAQQLLERTDQSVEQVASLSGFGSAEALRHHFRQSFRTSPSTWRRNFKGRSLVGE